jgi:hypothetical protein
MNVAFRGPPRITPSPCLVVELVEQGDSQLSLRDPGDPPGLIGIGTPPDTAGRYRGANLTC